MEKKKIAIVGGGISGLLACKHTMEMGFNPTVFEATNGVGGVWSSQTIESTKLQTPKDHYRFSDFEWQDSVTDTFPDHNRVLSYISSYAAHFNILDRIRFGSRVVSIEYHNIAPDSDPWNGSAFSRNGKWRVVVQNVLHPDLPDEVYEADFVILCIGKFSGVAKIPDFDKNEGPEVFDGKVIHSMDYAAMSNSQAAEFVKNKRVTVVGFQKSAVDIAAQIARLNGTEFPCTMVIRTAHWTVPEAMLKLLFNNLNRFSELLIHKPKERFLIWLLAVVASPLLWLFSKAVESYLKWIYPLKKHDMVPNHGFLGQMSSCKFTVLPPDFYDNVEQGSIVLKRSSTLSFCRNGLNLDDNDDDYSPLETDVVIFATGYASDEKLSRIFASSCFGKRFSGSSPPLYRGCIDPQIPQLAILGYSESPSILHTTEMQSKWLSQFLAGKFELPTMVEMEEDTIRWEKCARKYAGKHYKRSCVSVLLHIHCNNQLCNDMKFNPRRKRGFFSEIFSPYSPVDYSV